MEWSPQVPEMNFGMYPNTMVGGAGNVRTQAQAQAQYCYMVEPYPINVPYYAIPPYLAHPLPLPTCCGQGYFCHDRPVYQPQYQAPTTQVGDYFSDENTVGCSVMWVLHPPHRKPPFLVAWKWWQRRDDSFSMAFPWYYYSFLKEELANLSVFYITNFCNFDSLQSILLSNQL